MDVAFGWKDCAGLIGLYFLGYDVCLHLGVQREDWEWGYWESWFDGPIVSVCLGPVALLCMSGPPAEWTWKLTRALGRKPDPDFG